MAIPSKYPKAIPCHSPEELASQNSRLNQLNEELTAQSKRLTQWNDDLAQRAAQLRRWTARLIGVCAILVILSAVAVAVTIKYPTMVSPAASATVMPATDAKPTREGQEVKPISPAIDAKRAPMELPTQAIAKPDGGPANTGAGYLEALGGLSATHLFQSQLNVGLLADGVESETYTIEEAEKNLKTVVEMMKLVDTQLGKVSRTALEPADLDSIRQIQVVTQLLHVQADALRAYWATGEMEQAERYHKARKAAAQGLARVMGP